MKRAEPGTKSGPGSLRKTTTMKKNKTPNAPQTKTPNKELRTLDLEELPKVTGGLGEYRDVIYRNR